MKVPSTRSSRSVMAEWPIQVMPIVRKLMT